MKMRSIAAALLAVLAGPAAALAQTVPAPAEAPAEASEALTARIAGLAEILSGKGDYDAYFAPGFRAQVPKEKFAGITDQLVSGYGPLESVTVAKVLTPNAATLAIRFRDADASANITIDAAEPHQVLGLLITGIAGREKSVGEVTDAIRALPGMTGFAIAKLGEGKPELITSIEPDTPRAVGSAFKLVILAELIRETNAGERGWDDKVELDGSPLPGGTYTLYPRGATVTLRELATKMISISDNSATDILIHTLGRAKLEAMLPVLGVVDPARDRPFMTTLEMFKLKGVEKGALAARYLGKDEAGRRAMLDGEVGAIPLAAIDPELFKDGKPLLIDTLEWYFTPTDLVRIMDWIRRNSASGGGAAARSILSVNPGITPQTAAAWNYVGYKGGSEPGVLNMTLLLEGKDKSWYVITGSWNNLEAEVNLGKFVGLIGRAAQLLAPN